MVPASVWSPHAPVDPDAEWPEPILDEIITTLSAPGQRVALLTGAAESDDPPGPAYGTPARALVPPGTLAAARELAATHHRPPHIAHWRGHPGSQAAEVFWARFVHPTPTGAAYAGTADPHQPPLTPNHHDDAAVEAAPLVIATVDPGGVSDTFGVVAAELLRDGGTLAVITHCDRHEGRLRDPSGSVVASCQNADLLYLQHIVALHHPIATGRLTRPARRPTRPVTRHRRVHSDVYLFGWHGQQIAQAVGERAA